MPGPRCGLRLCVSTCLSVSTRLCVSPCLGLGLSLHLRFGLRLRFSQCLSLRQSVSLCQCLGLRLGFGIRKSFGLGQRLSLGQVFGFGPCVGFGLKFGGRQSLGFQLGALGLFSNGSALGRVGLGAGLVNGLGQARLQAVDALDRALGLADCGTRAFGDFWWQAQRLLAQRIGQTVQRLGLFEQFGHRSDTCRQNRQRGRQPGRSQPPAALVQVPLKVVFARLQGVDLCLDIGKPRLTLLLQLRGSGAQRRGRLCQGFVAALDLLCICRRQRATSLCQQARQLLVQVIGLGDVIRQLFGQSRRLGQQ